MDVVTADDCKKILDNYLKQSQEFLNFELNPFSDKTVGFLGEHVCLTIYFKCNNTKEKINLFLKCLPRERETQRKYVEEMQVFKKETLLYNDIIPQLLQVSSIKFAPNCYLVKPDCIVLENLREVGFVPERKTFNLAYCKSAIKAVAALHSASIIYEEHKSKAEGKIFRFNERYPAALQEGTFSAVVGHPRQKWAVNSTKAIADCIKLVPGYENSAQVTEKLWNLLSLHLSKFIKPSGIYRNVIVHDDLWCNNIVFRKQGDNDVECLLVDFQLTRYVPPALDLLLLLYLNLDRNLLQKNFDDLANTYYNFFCENLRDHGVDIKTVLPEKAFLQSIEDYKLPALYEATIYGTNVFISQELSNLITSSEEIFEEFATTNRSKYVCEEFQKNPVFNKRFTDVLIPLLDCLQE